ncbi:MAG: hypothetical protein FJ299_00025 [Planctomycetes bacterium]|nr:hypothetical protein [Planctomycetota bacterium]
MKPTILIERATHPIGTSPRRAAATAFRPLTDSGASTHRTPEDGPGLGNLSAQRERNLAFRADLGSQLSRQRRLTPSVRRTAQPAPARRAPSTDCEPRGGLAGQPERARFHRRLQQVVDNPLLSLLFFSSLIAMTFLV